MKKIINGYEISTCTAVAVGVDEARQPALFVHKLGDVNREGDAVVFGWDIAWLDGDSDLESMFDDQSAWAFDQETLATMEESKGGTKMSNITFTEIPNTNGHISEFGYRLVGHSEFSEEVRQAVGVNLMDDWIDGLADGFGSIYQGSDGNNYLVHFCYWYDPPVPACWWRVEKEA